MRFQLAAARGLGLALLAGALLGGTEARAEDVTLALAVHEGGFEPATVQAPASARIRLEVANQTGGVMEFESFELNRERVVQPGQKVVVYLSGLSPGRYEFFDDFNHERRGVLQVE